MTDGSSPVTPPRRDRRKWPLVVVVLVGLFVLVGVFPAWGVLYESNHGMSLGPSFVEILAFGAIVAILTVLVWVLRPTPAYGFLKVLSSLAKIGIFLFLGAIFTVSDTFTSGDAIVTATVGSGEIFYLLLIAPAVGLVSGILFIVLDRQFPGYRAEKEHERS